MKVKTDEGINLLVIIKFTFEILLALNLFPLKRVALTSRCSNQTEGIYRCPTIIAANFTLDQMQVNSNSISSSILINRMLFKRYYFTAVLFHEMNFEKMKINHKKTQIRSV